MASTAGRGSRPARTILYIEGNPASVLLMERVLQQRPGVQLIPAETGALGLTTAAREPVDVVLLNLDLPDMTGEAVLAQLRGAPSTATIPIAIVTDHGLHGDAKRLRAAGASAVVPMPFDLPQLLATIDDLMRDATS